MINTNVDSFKRKISSNKLDIFEEFDISSPISIKNSSPEINKVVEFLSYPSIKNVHFVEGSIESSLGISNDCNNNDLNKLIVEIELKETVIYTTKSVSEYVHNHNIVTVKSLPVSIPKVINDRSTYELYRSKRFQVNPYIENIHVRKLDDTTIFRTMLLLLDIKFFI
ncbi:hypothetical protein [Paraclostridium dentum]|uniref:hypothetical protein n=1 Tax=Paraclostridium dentum TaxID=2662455 RepID=UPI003F2C2FA6